MKEFEITQLHAFPFSAHLDHYSVPAGKYENQIPNHITQSRLKKLLQTGEEVFESFAQNQKQKILSVLVEKTSEN